MMHRWSIAWSLIAAFGFLGIALFAGQWAAPALITLVDRARGLTSRAKMKRLAQAYEVHRNSGLLPATFEAVFAHAWKPVAKGPAGVEVEPPRL